MRDAGYDNHFDEQLAALDQVRQVQRRLLPVRNRERLDDIVRCFTGMRLDTAIDRIAAVGFDEWLKEGMALHTGAAITAQWSGHAEDALVQEIFYGGRR